MAEKTVDGKTRLAIMAGSFLLVLFAVFFTVGTVTSSVMYGIRLAGMLPVWVPAAAAMTFAVTLWRGKGFLLCTAIVLMAVLYKLPGIVTGAKWILFTVTNEVNKYFDIKVLLQGASASYEEIKLCITIIGLLIMLPLSSAICLRRSCSYTVLISAPFILPTLALNDNAPSLIFLVGILAIYLVLLFSAVLHPNDFNGRGVAVFPAIAIAAALLFATYLVTPTDNNKRGDLIFSIESGLRKLAPTADKITANPGVGWPANTSDRWRFNSTNVHVADAGPRTVTDAEVLEITSTVAGTFYLRGFSMQEFDGRSWLYDADAVYGPNSIDMGLLETPARIAERYGELYPRNAPLLASMAVRKTTDQSTFGYYPYYSLYSSMRSASVGIPQDDYFDGEDSSVNYAIIDIFGNDTEAPAGSTLVHVNGANVVDFYHTDMSIPDAAAAISADFAIDSQRINDSMTAMAGHYYLEIEPATAEKLRQLAAQAGVSADFNRDLIADRVADYVSSSARYTLSPPTTPEGEDFAVYFLQTARRGYCIHFATAATLMLRALDVPARFTCGFLVTVDERDVGTPVSVTDRSAHAWVEVYYEGVGWVPLEPSPSSLSYAIPERSSSLSVRESNADDSRLANDNVREDRLDEITWTPPPTETPGSPVASGASSEPTKTGVVVLILFVCVSVCVVALILHNRFVRRKRAQGFGQQDANAAVLCVWRYISLLGRIRLGRMRIGRRRGHLGRSVRLPEEIEALALKARFSNHRITEPERAAAIAVATDLSNSVRQQSSQLKLLYIRYIRALI